MSPPRTNIYVAKTKNTASDSGMQRVCKEQGQTGTESVARRVDGTGSVEESRGKRDKVGPIQSSHPSPVCSNTYLITPAPLKSTL